MRYIVTCAPRVHRLKTLQMRYVDTHDGIATGRRPGEDRASPCLVMFIEGSITNLNGDRPGHG